VCSMQQSWTNTRNVIYEGFACTAPQPEEGQGVMYRLLSAWHLTVCKLSCDDLCNQ
jgi:hypothetical protein